LYNQTRNRWITNDILNKIKNNQSLSSDDLEFLRPAVDGFLRQQLSPDYMNYRVYPHGYDDKIVGPLHGPLLESVDKIREFMEDKVVPEVEISAPNLSRYYTSDAKKEELLDYFKSNPNVSGMAIGAGLNGIDGDRRVVLNPYSNLTDEQKQSVVRNEKYRHYLNENPVYLFNPTLEQYKFFEGTPY
jgi:hypothetical protein